MHTVCCSCYSNYYSNIDRYNYYEICAWSEFTLLHGVGDTNYTSTSSPITLSPGHTIDTLTNSLLGVLKLYADKSLIAIISELTLVNNNVPVNAAPRACKLNVLGGDSTVTVDCNSPSTSSFSSPTSPTSATSVPGSLISTTSATSMTSVTSSSHSSTTSQSSTARQSTSIPSSKINAVTTTRSRPTASTKTTSSSLVHTTSIQTLKTSLTTSISRPSSTSASSGTSVFSVEVIVLVVLVALVGVMSGMMIVGCFYYMHQHKRGSGDVISTINNNMSLHYSPLDNHELEIDVETEATFSINRATVDEDEKKMLY